MSKKTVSRNQNGHRSKSELPPRSDVDARLPPVWELGAVSAAGFLCHASVWYRPSMLWVAQVLGFGSFVGCSAFFAESLSRLAFQVGLVTRRLLRVDFRAFADRSTQRAFCCVSSGSFRFSEDRMLAGRLRSFGAAVERPWRPVDICAYARRLTESSVREKTRLPRQAAEKRVFKKKAPGTAV